MTGRTTLPPIPCLVVGTVAHTRHTPIRHSFRHRHFQWLVDVDALPRYPWPLSVVASFRAADHLDGGASGAGIRGDLALYLASRGITVRDADQVLMLAQARTAGHVFDPLTVFWCVNSQGSVFATVLEVHNTYGGRHAYLLEPQLSGESLLDKEFYVSPFNDISGTYRVRLRLQDDRVGTCVTLERDGQRILTASAAGSPLPATPRTVIRVTARHFVMTYRVSALIRVHGIWLWLRRLPVVPRPPSPAEAT